MKHKLLTALLLTAMAAVSAPAAVATTWHVNGVTGSDNNNCLSSTTACKTIGHAISLASSGDSSIRRGGDDTTISGNSAIFGGGIANGGTLELVNSTIEGNFAAGYVISGGHFQPPRGGGIDNFGTSTISNTTIANNAAIFAPPVGPCHFYVCYVSGMDIAGPITIEDSIVANAIYHGLNCNGAVNSKGYNLSSDSTCNFNKSGDRNNIDPKLGPLRYNGGPTQTMALLSGSPAIDSGNPSGCADGQGQLLKTDQRGMPRPDAEDTRGCDMGAYERQSD